MTQTLSSDAGEGDVTFGAAAAEGAWRRNTSWSTSQSARTWRCWIRCCCSFVCSPRCCLRGRGGEGGSVSGRRLKGRWQNGKWRKFPVRDVTVVWCEFLTAASEAAYGSDGDGQSGVAMWWMWRMLGKRGNRRNKMWSLTAVDIRRRKKCSWEKDKDVAWAWFITVGGSGSVMRWEWVTSHRSRVERSCSRRRRAYASLHAITPNMILVTLTAQLSAKTDNTDANKNTCTECIRINIKAWASLSIKIHTWHLTLSIMVLIRGSSEHSAPSIKADLTGQPRINRSRGYCSLPPSPTPLPGTPMGPVPQQCHRCPWAPPLANDNVTLPPKKSP